MVKYLIENGADIHAQNDEALKLASRYCHIDVVKFLRSYISICNFLLYALNKKKPNPVLSKLVMAVFYKDRFFQTIHLPKIYSDKICPICREDVVYKHVLKCGHVYHSKCIKNWSKTRGKLKCCYNCN